MKQKNKKSVDPLGKSAINCLDKKISKKLEAYEEKQQRYKERTEKKVQDVITNVPDNYLEQVRQKTWEKNNPGKKWDKTKNV